MRKAHAEEANFMELEAKPYCEEQAPDESLQTYSHRVLAYALVYGVEPLTLSQLDLADYVAAGHVAMLPAKLSAEQARHNAILARIRTRLQFAATSKRAQRAKLQAMLERDLAQDPIVLSPVPTDNNRQSEVLKNDTERALLLLRAALTLIMAPQGNGTDSADSNPGHGAKLQPPSPKLPPSGITRRF